MILKERFDLAVLARKRSKRGTIEMRPIGPRLSSETELYRIILRVLKEYDDAKPELLRGALVTKQELTLDAYGLGDIVRAMRTAFSQATNLARSNVESLFEGDARRHDERWIDQVNRVVGVDLKAVVRSEQIAPTIEAAVQTNVALIRGLSEDVAKKVEVTLLEMIPRGASTREMAKTLNDIGNFGKARAKLIAIDQTSSFNANLNQIRQRQAGVDRYIWSTSRDARVRPLHRAREGEMFRWDTPPSDGHPGRPIRCFKGSTVVDLSNGCHQFWRRLYEGPLVAVVTGQGRLLEATPNHPVLTGRGWLPINALQKGDYLVQRSDRGFVLQDQADVLEASFEEAFDALVATQGFKTATGTRFDFHGDGAERDVDIVVLDSDLAARAKASLLQSVEHFLFARSSVDRLSEFNQSSPITLSGIGNLLEANSIVGRACQLRALLGAELGHAEVSSRGSRAALYTLLTQDTGNDDAFKVEVPRDGKLALARAIQTYDLVYRKIIPAIVGASARAGVLPEPLSRERLGEIVAVAAQKGCGLTNGLPAGYEFARVTEKSVRKFAGHVYTIETNTGWYFSDGFAASNCRCVARPVLDLDAPAVRKSERNRARREGTRAVEAALGL